MTTRIHNVGSTGRLGWIGFEWNEFIEFDHSSAIDSIRCNVLVIGRRRHPCISSTELILNVGCSVDKKCKDDVMLMKHSVLVKNGSLLQMRKFGPDIPISTGVALFLIMGSFFWDTPYLPMNVAVRLSEEMIESKC